LAQETETYFEAIDRQACTPSMNRVAPSENDDAELSLELPAAKPDLDIIYTDTVARVKLPRHRSLVVKRNS
jgi:hypothetical protein